MSDKSLLEMESAANTINQAALLIAESVSVVIEVVSRLGENMHCQYSNPPHAPYGEGEFQDLTDRLQTAIDESKKKSPPKPPKRKKYINKQKASTTLSPQTPLSHAEATDLPAEQKKTKTYISRNLQMMAENDDMPAEYQAYAERKKINPQSMVPMFIDFVLYHSKKNSKMANWYAAWQTWVRNQLVFEPSCKSATGLQRLTESVMGDVLEN